MNPSQTLTNQISIRPDLTLSVEPLQNLCQHWKIVELALFGSVLRDDFNPNSDIDLLITFADSARITFFDLDEIEQQFSILFENRPVDVVTRNAIEQSHNPIRRQNILNNAKIIYEQRSGSAT
ncbi:MAG: nucleotidyltransferase domain-containing protein [Geitlerinemataceae cyanobacterium]